MLFGVKGHQPPLFWIVTGVKDDFGFMLICVRLNEQNMYQIVALVMEVCIY
jgi:hypothetical protein